MQLRKVSPSQADVAALIDLSTEYMNQRYPQESNYLDDSTELSKPNVYFIGAYDGCHLAGMGAVKLLKDKEDYGEIKRVFVARQFRAKGVAGAIMNRLESHLVANKILLAKLETGIYQPEAIAMYQNRGYVPCQPFGHYPADDLSIFMQKTLNSDE